MRWTNDQFFSSGMCKHQLAVLKLDGRLALSEQISPFRGKGPSTRHFAVALIECQVLAFSRSSFGGVHIAPSVQELAPRQPRIVECPDIQDPTQTET